MKYESVRYIFTVGIRQLILVALKRKLSDHLVLHGSKLCEVSTAQGNHVETLYTSVWISSSSLIKYSCVFLIPFFLVIGFEEKLCY